MMAMTKKEHEFYMFLQEKGGELRATNEEIAKILNLNTSVITKRIKSLVKKGYIVKDIGYIAIK